MILLILDPNWLNEQITPFLNYVINSVMVEIFDGIGEFFTDINWIYEISGAVTLINLTTVFATSLLSVVVLWKLFTVQGIGVSDDPDKDPLDQVKRAMITIAVVTTHPFVFNKIMEMSDLMYAYFVTPITVDEYYAENFSDLITNGPSAGGGFLIFIFGVYLAILIFKALKRAVELMFIKILYPLFALGIMWGTMELFRNFMKSYFIVAFGYIIQVICVRLAMTLVYSMGGTVEHTVIKGIAILMFAASSPEWIRQITYTTGTGKQVSGGARSAAYMLPQLARSLKA